MSGSNLGSSRRTIYARGKSPRSRLIANRNSKRFCLPWRSLKKALIAQCMMVYTTAVHRNLERPYGQNRFSYRGCYIGCEPASFVAGTGESGEW
jgi:hypothetical protein